ncbi:MAG: trigger factor [Pseudomonadota bacterium]
MIELKQTLDEDLRCAFSVTIVEDGIKTRLNDKLREVGQGARIPGFRPGKAPLAVLHQRYGEQVRSEVLQGLLGEARDKAIKDHDLRPARQPQLDDVSQEGGFSFTMTFDLLPTITLPDPAKIEIESPAVPATPDLVDERLEQITATQATFNPLKGKKDKAQLRDRVTVDFAGELADGRKPDQMQSKDHAAVIGAGMLIEGLEAGLTGMSIGQSKKIPVTMPKDSPFSGQKATFACKVTAIERPEFPAIDDAFAKSLGLEGVSQLREAVEKQVQERLDGICRNQAKQHLLDALAKAIDFALPDFMLAGEKANLAAQLNQSGERVDDKEIESIARRRLGLGLMFAQYAQVHDITVADDELNRAITAQAQSRPEQFREILEFFQKNPDRQQELRGQILEEKVVDWLLSLAKVKKKTMTLEALQKQADEASARQAKASKPKARKAAKKSEKTANKTASKTAKEKPVAKESTVKSATKKPAAKTKPAKPATKKTS